MLRRQDPDHEFTACHSCHYHDSVLPWEMLEAVNQGNISKVKEYIEEDNDVNAFYEEDTMLSRACADGHTEIVALLLQCPNLHLNRRSQGMTPLMIAARHGHYECMKLLLDSTHKCELHIVGCWHVLAKVLATNPELKLKSALRILGSAGRHEQWEVVKLILATNHHFTRKDLEPLILNAAIGQRFDVLREVFKRDFLEKNILLCQVLPVVVRMRCWERVEEVLHMMSEQLKLNIPLAEAVLAGKEEEVIKLSDEGDRNPQILNGILLVAAAGGTTDQVAKFLLSFVDTYAQNTFQEAFIMAYAMDSVALLPRILSHKDARFTLQDLNNMHQAVEFIPGCFHSHRESFVKNFFNKYVRENQDMKTGGLNIID